MKKIIFLTGTRADFSKKKALISILDIHPDFEVFVLLRNAPARRVWIYTVRN
jgi:UDP-N-acetylglucosamine 2-epimerase (hydrolysing)